VRKLFVLVPAALILTAAAAPSLRVFSGDGFTTGMWRATPLDADSQSRAPTGKAQCLADPAALVHAGFSAATGDCTYTVIEDTASQATVTYVCRGQGTGRVEVRKVDAGSFTVDARGISGREPFETRAEYKRTGDCR
jgi:hypothetical protein